MIASWITVSRRRATNREPDPASTSSSVTPSGVATTIRSSRCTWEPRRVRARTGAGVDRARAARRHGREQARRGSAPTVCAGSVRRTARPRPTSRSRAGSFPAIRCSVDSNGSCSAAAHAVYHTARSTGTLREFVDARLLAPHPRAHRARRDRARLPLRPGRCSAATGRGAIPGAASGLVPRSVPVRHRAAHAGRGLGVSRRRPGRDLAARSSPTTSASRSSRSRAGSCSASARCTC